MSECTWVLVDDTTVEAQSFADQLNLEGKLSIVVMNPGEAKNKILGGEFVPDGVLMDVDLSNIPGERGTGPGIAQDIRVKQKSNELSEFPVVRFAALAPVLKHVQGDPSSDDLFDLKIQKEDVVSSREAIRGQLFGLGEVYKALREFRGQEAEWISEFLACDRERLDGYGNLSFESRMLSSLQISPHVAAGAFMKGFMLCSGLLISESVMSVRLGVDKKASGDSWLRLLATLDFKYKGVAAEYFSRWWSKGLDFWWFDEVQCERPLVSLASAQRVSIIAEKLSIEGLVPLSMPVGSPGEKPWSFCTLGLEKNPPLEIPVDLNEAVRLQPRTDLPHWIDPCFASLKYALQEKNDLRLNRSDIARLSLKYRS